ncbi:MAG TPA: hypothetical protein VFP87_08225 [Chitinophagaceae bacterium]|nr:hypothetical protein [Chitinophagaceae bacterium]
MKKPKNLAFAGKISLAVTIVLSIVFINSCKREAPGAGEQLENVIKPKVLACAPGYHWDFNLRQCVPNCPSGYEYCAALGRCVPSGTCSSTGNDIDKFKSSADFASFINSNPTIAAKINYGGAKIRIDYNKLLGDDLKTIHFPVIETTGDTSAMVIGVPVIVDNVTNYLIFYESNQVLTRDSRGYLYGTVQADLYNTTASYTAQFDSNLELVSDTVVAGPRFINNFSCNTCKLVWPTRTCIRDAKAYFFATCDCRELCAASDRYGYYSCSLGTFFGAAAFCAAHNNLPHT